jgi:hypothetical protein
MDSSDFYTSFVWLEFAGGGARATRPFNTKRLATLADSRGRLSPHKPSSFDRFAHGGFGEEAR